MKKIFLALGLLFLLFPQVASAQSQRNPCFYNVGPGTGDGCKPVSTVNPLPVTSSVTGFTPNGNFANLTATAASASVALPSGTTIAVQNTGTSTVSCTLGVGSATAVASQIQIAAASTVFVAPGANTFIGCIDQTGSASNVVALAGGTGLGAGFGGGGGVANQSVNLAQVAGVATPVGSGVQATALRTTIATDSPGIIATGGATTALSVPVALNSQYPVNSVTTAPTGITGNGTGTTGAVVGTLSGAASVTTFICGFNVSATGGTAAVGPVTVAGLIGSSMVFQLFSTAAGANLTQTFNPCIPASTVNTAITVTTTADGTATAVDVNSWGYRL